jgi:competence protein ComEC
VQDRRLPLPSARNVTRRSGARVLLLRAPVSPSPPHPIDPLLVLGIALVLGGVALVAPWEVGVGAVVSLALAWRVRRVGRAVAFIAGVGIAVGALRGREAIVRHERERAAANEAIGPPLRCAARAVVDSSPVRVRDTLRWDARIENAECDGGHASWSGRATLYGGPDELARGDAVDVVATLGAPQRLWNGATGDPRPGEARRGVVRSGGALDVRWVRRASGLLAWVDRKRARVRARIEATFPADLAPMARALVLGESDLAPEDDRAFRASGLSHLLAVSGMHLVLVLAVFVRLLEGVLVRVERIAARVDVGRIAAVVGVVVAWVYSEFAGAGGSTVRAAWMATVALSARALGRRSDANRAFGLSLVAMAAADPLVAFDLSFALSAGATAGLLAFARPIGEAFASRVPRLVAPVARAAGTTLAATIPCAPLIARFAPTVPVGGVVANLVAVPVGESVALPLCLAHAALGWWPAAERGCAVVASGALVVVRGVARGFAAPALTTQVPQPTSWQMVVLAIALAALALGRWPGRQSLLAAASAALLLLEAGARRAGAPRGVLRATFLDVGQGDSAIIDLPDGGAVVVDGGGLVGSPIDVGERVLAPELRARRRDAVTLAVLTHPHPDHFGGLPAGLSAVRLGALWETGEGEQEGVGGGYAALLGLARSRGVPVARPDALCGSHVLGGARVEVLAPCPAYSPDRRANDNSIVLRISYGARALLLVGDAEREEEGELLERAPELLRADVLKVGHHGSRTSSSREFLAAVAPREAVVSAGCRNRFGHPHPATLAALAAQGARVWRTDQRGAVVVTTDGVSLDVGAVGD